MILKKKKRAKMGLRESSVVRSPGHMKFVRSFECCVQGAGVQCEFNVEAHHVQSYRAIEAGMGMKCGDDKCVPLCRVHHQQIHDIGQAAFEKKYGLNLEKVAADLWKDDSYHRAKWENRNC